MGRQPAPKEKTPRQPTGGTGTVEKDTGTDSRQGMAGKKAHNTEGNQQSKRKGQDSTRTFFSETVLCTQHDNVATYPEPIADLLLAVDRQEHGDTKRHTQVYCKWIYLHGLKGEKI